MASRMGKRKPGKSSIGLYVDDDFRALLALVVDMTGETATDIIMDGVRTRATALGILRNDKVVPEFVPAIEIIKEAFAHRRANATLMVFHAACLFPPGLVVFPPAGGAAPYSGILFAGGMV